MARSPVGPFRICGDDMPDEKQATEKKQSWVSALYQKLQGRTTSFLVAFFVTGVGFHLFHRLDAVFIAFMSTHMTFVVGHSIKEDYFKSAEDK